MNIFILLGQIKIEIGSICRIRSFAQFDLDKATQNQLGQPRELLSIKLLKINWQKLNCVAQTIPAPLTIEE